MSVVSHLDLGFYEAPRAAALSGVPKSTVYYWARTEVVIPSIAPDYGKLWSYGDLLTLRLVRWLRTDKSEIARTTMRDVRDALAERGDDLWRIDDLGARVPTICVDRSGDVIIVDDSDAAPRRPSGQHLLGEDVLDLFKPFGETGVDLRQPRRRLRIVPGKVAGEPHLEGSRLTTVAVAALASRGFDMNTIRQLYPHEDPDAIREAIDLEETLTAA